MLSISLLLFFSFPSFLELFLVLFFVFFYKKCLPSGLQRFAQAVFLKRSASNRFSRRFEVLAYQSFVQHVHREEDLDQPAFHGLSAPLMQAPALTTGGKHKESMAKVIRTHGKTLEKLLFVKATRNYNPSKSLEIHHVSPFF